jgi:hypothetical protein
MLYKLHGKTYTTEKGAKIAARAWLRQQPAAKYGLNTWCDIQVLRNGEPLEWLRIFKQL